MAASIEQGQGKGLNICLGDRVEVKLEDPDGSETWYSAIVTDFYRSIAEVDEENAVEFEVLYDGEGADYAVPYGLDLRKDELRIVEIVVPNGIEPHVYIPALRCLRRVSHISTYSEPHFIL